MVQLYGVLIAVTVAVTLVSLKAFADINEALDGNPAMRRGARAQALYNTDDTAGKPGVGKILGTCSIIPGGSNILGGPCLNLIVILTDQNGKEIRHTRTDGSGHFVLIAEPRGKYKVMADPKFYEVVGPMEILRSGQQINLRLKQKN